MVQLVIRNSGSSLPPDFDPRHSQSLGLQIVQTLVHDDLKGDLKITSIVPPVTPSSTGLAAQDGEASSADLQAASTEGAILQGTQATVVFPKRSLKVD